MLAMVYTVNEPNRAKELKVLGTAGIVTDYLDKIPPAI
jgi:hypothetical protein